jgi:hypothetical protein
MVSLPLGVAALPSASSSHLFISAQAGISPFPLFMCSTKKIYVWMGRDTLFGSLGKYEGMTYDLDWTGNCLDSAGKAKETNLS